VATGAGGQAGGRPGEGGGREKGGELVVEECEVKRVARGGGEG